MSWQQAERSKSRTQNLVLVIAMHTDPLLGITHAHGRRGSGAAQSAAATAAATAAAAAVATLPADAGVGVGVVVPAQAPPVSKRSEEDRARTAVLT